MNRKTKQNKTNRKEQYCTKFPGFLFSFFDMMLHLFLEQEAENVVKEINDISFNMVTVWDCES